MKNYKNFVSKNAVHEEGFAYVDIKDENGANWYEIQKNFQEKTFKILYYSDSKMVIGYNEDVSMLAPFENTSVIEVEKIPDFEILNELFVLEKKFKLVKLSKFEKIVDNSILEDVELKNKFYKKKQKELQRNFLKLKLEKEEFLQLGFNTEETVKEIEVISNELKEVNSILKNIKIK